MSDRPENFRPAGEDPEATLVTPRFDADEARRAHPVVPLADVPPRTPYARASDLRRGRAPRRAWTPALLAVALLAVAAVGGAVATKVMQSPRAERVREQTEAAPVVQTAEAPPQTLTSPAAEAPRESAPAKPSARDTRTRRARAAAAESARDVEEFDEDEDRRGKGGEKRRERDEEEVEKELRKALKRAKGRAPRLVDVLTSP